MKRYERYKKLFEGAISKDVNVYHSKELHTLRKGQKVFSNYTGAYYYVNEKNGKNRLEYEGIVSPNGWEDTHIIVLK